MRVRAQVTMQGGSGLPEDRFVNTFHFSGAAAGDLDANANAITPELQEFYTGTVSGAALSAHFSIYIDRSATIRFYDLDQATPRVPIIKTLSLWASNGSGTLPEECAAVLSLRGSLPVTPRKRGRIYLGPLNISTITPATATTPTRLNSGFRTTVTTKAAALADADIGWCIYSPTDDAMVPILGGFIDDAYDTQRRRGPDAAVRELWTKP